MVSVKYEDLREYYVENYKSAITNENKIADVVAICKKIEKYKNIYDRITKQSRSTVPWWFIGVIHYRESSFSFSKHIHNGDSLSSRTVNVPSGRPITGNPPFTFEDSVSDILAYKKLNEENSWHYLSRTLWLLEKYNGFGYLKYHPEVMTPYLWGATNKYISGGYASDGNFKKDYVSKQIGCVPIIKNFVENGIILFEDITKHITPITNSSTGVIEIENVLQNLGK